MVSHGFWQGVLEEGGLDGEDSVSRFSAWCRSAGWTVVVEKVSEVRGSLIMEKKFELNKLWNGGPVRVWRG